MDTELAYGMGIKLTRSEHRRLEELAKRTGRSKNQVVRALLRLATVRDNEVLQLVRLEAKNGG